MNRVQEIRKERNITQVQLAKYAGISRKYLSNVENQLANPSIPSAYRNRFVELYPEKGFDKACNIAFKKEKLKRPIIHAAKMCVKKVLGRR